MRETGIYQTAVIEIGSTGIRLIVAEVSPGGNWKVLDRAGKPVALGRDVFTSGTVTRESFMECLEVLRNFKEFLSGWDVGGDNVHVIATSALRVARNRDVFVDRVRQETGFIVSIVEGIEENRLMYLAVRFALKDDYPLFWRANSMILDIGGGSTEIMLLRRGQMVAAHSLKLGTILIGRSSRFDTPSSRERYLNENIKNTSEFLSSELDLSHIRMFIVSGSDARVAAVWAGTEVNENCRVIERDAFIEFAERIEHYSPEECMEKFSIAFADAENLVPGLMIYAFLLKQTDAAKVIVPLVSIREGVLVDLAVGVDTGLQEEFYSQVGASAVSLGRKYHYDEGHSRHVATLATAMFDALVKEHGMSRRERMMLEAAAILHDIGMFIKASGHHLHGRYIVANSEIFGLHQNELDIIATVVRYHRGEPPAPQDIDYLSLDREERILVLKMASILRVADALDRGHSQKIKNFTVETRDEYLLIHVPGNPDLSLERIGLEKKADLFQEVFGYKVIIG